MADELKRTVRIVRRSKVSTDDRGRTVWSDPVESAELELVSTTMLHRVLEDGDDSTKQQIRDAAKGQDGVLAHDPDLDRFEIISDEELQAALAAQSDSESLTRPADVTLEPVTGGSDAEDEELSLVSTQMLRQLIDGDDIPDDSGLADDEDGGFDPYNSG